MSSCISWPLCVWNIRNVIRSSVHARVERSYVIPPEIGIFFGVKMAQRTQILILGVTRSIKKVQQNEEFSSLSNLKVAELLCVEYLVPWQS